MPDTLLSRAITARTQLQPHESATVSNPYNASPLRSLGTLFYWPVATFCISSTKISVLTRRRVSAKSHSVESGRHP